MSCNSKEKRLRKLISPNHDIPPMPHSHLSSHFLSLYCGGMPCEVGIESKVEKLKTSH